MAAPWRLLERDTGRTILDRLEIADRYWSRLVGLQFRSEPPSGFGLLLAPCPSVHTFFVRFPVDLAMFDRAGRVLEVRREVRPWRVPMPTKRTFAILEVPTTHRVDLDVGALVRIEAPDVDRRRLSKALAAWCGES